MTTTRNETRPADAGTSAANRCEGCPRCDAPGTALCPACHGQYGGLHPRCKACGHCVLRGKHQDEGSDLKNIHFDQNLGMAPISPN